MILLHVMNISIKKDFFPTLNLLVLILEISEGLGYLFWKQMDNTASISKKEIVDLEVCASGWPPETQLNHIHNSKCMHIFLGSRMYLSSNTERSLWPKNLKTMTVSFHIRWHSCEAFIIPFSNMGFSSLIFICLLDSLSF